MYDSTPIPAELLARLEEQLTRGLDGVFGSRPRFQLAAARPGDSDSLKGLGTYGMIVGASAYIIGAVSPSPRNLEDYGYVLEQHVLFATGLGLGTCWLGGTFTRSSFAERISAGPEEQVPAVISVGKIGNEWLARRHPVRLAGGSRRMAWNQLFFRDDFGTPLTESTAGEYALPLEMVRIAPSASNKQPWRMVVAGSQVHLYLRRTPGYYDPTEAPRTGKTESQRVDMGIAMAHFELTAREAGLPGRWQAADPGIKLPDGQMEYVGSWG
jgi:hypothetical protein